MQFLKNLSEQYRLFIIDDEDDKIIEIPLDDVLDDESEESDFDQDFDADEDSETAEDEPDFDDIEDKEYHPDGDEEEGADDEFDFSDEDTLDFDEDEDDEEGEYDLDPKNFVAPGDKSFTRSDASSYNKNLDPNEDDGRAELDDSDDDEISKGDMELDPELSGVPFEHEDEDEEDDTEFSDEHPGAEEAPEDMNSDMYRDENNASHFADDDGMDQANTSRADGNEVDDEDDDEDEFNFGDEDEEDMDDDSEDEEGEDSEDENYQGVIRTVPGAYLVFKKQNLDSDDGTYTELWIYSIGERGDVGKQHETKRAILAGTDIDPKSLDSTSEDDQQYAEQWSKGNVCMLKICGLPS